MHTQTIYLSYRVRRSKQTVQYYGQGISTYKSSYLGVVFFFNFSLIFFENV